jgi:3-hydroxyacyl-CoA dehydrogenase
MTADIKKVAVIGAGVMGASIAAHVANAGVPVLLLDIVPHDAASRKGGFTAVWKRQHLGEELAQPCRALRQKDVSRLDLRCLANAGMI